MTPTYRIVSTLQTNSAPAVKAEALWKLNNRLAAAKRW